MRAILAANLGNIAAGAAALLVIVLAVLRLARRPRGGCPRGCPGCGKC